MISDGTFRQVCRIKVDGVEGWAVAWRFDDYWDLHFQPDGRDIDIEPLDELLPTLEACRNSADIWRPTALERSLGL